MKNTSFRFVLTTLGLSMLFASAVPAAVEPGWPAGQPNSCRSASDTFMNFENGIEAVQIASSIPGIEFTTTQGINWRYGDIRTGNYNVYPYNSALYETNGNVFAWLGVDGDAGRITFEGGTATYVSVLVSTGSGVTIDAYDATGNLIANSGWASSNLGTRTMTRLTVEAPNIAYVIIHDTGNYWLMDDLCTDAKPVCIPVENRSKGDEPDRIDLVFVPDADYGAPEDIDTWLPGFLANVNHQIDSQLGGKAPVTGNLDKFNFYYTRQQGDVVGSGSGRNCSRESSLPEDLVANCPFADAIVVLHTEQFGDCSSVNRAPDIFSAEGNVDRSFIHEAGHGVFGVADEYDGSPACSTYYFQPTPNPNIWATEAACRSDATAAAWDADDCQRFTTCQDDWWKLGTTNYIMADGSYFANGWGDPASAHLEWVLGQYSSRRLVGAATRSVLLDLGVDARGMRELGKEFVVAPSPEYLPGRYDFTARVFSPGNQQLGAFGFGEPRRILGEPGYDGPTLLEAAEFLLVLPHFGNGSRVDIVDEVTGATLTSIDISAFMDPSAPQNDPPTAVAGGDQTAECSGPAGTVFWLDGTASSDPEGAGITCRWLSATCTFADANACVTNAACPFGSNTATLVVSDGEAESAPDDVVLSVVDTVPPGGRITFPVDNMCLAPPVTVRDDFTDACTGMLVRTYMPAPGPTYGGEGTFVVTLNVTDDAGNTAMDEVSFTSDGTAPVVVIRGLPSMQQKLPREEPFARFVATTDEDAAPGGVTRERLLVDGCVVYDGATYGNRDGLLTDETFGIVKPLICDVYRACGRTRFSSAVIRVEAEDCAGNIGNAEAVVPGAYVVNPGGC